VLYFETEKCQIPLYLVCGLFFTSQEMRITSHVTSKSSSMLRFACS